MRKRVFIFEKAALRPGSLYFLGEDFTLTDSLGRDYYDERICFDGMTRLYPHTSNASKIKVIITGEKPASLPDLSGAVWGIYSQPWIMHPKLSFIMRGRKGNLPVPQLLGNPQKDAKWWELYFDTAELLRSVTKGDPFWITVEVLESLTGEKS